MKTEKPTKEPGAEKPMDEAELPLEELFNPPIPGAFPLYGIFKEKIWYAPDFDEPLEEFQPYE